MSGGTGRKGIRGEGTHEIDLVGSWLPKQGPGRSMSKDPRKKKRTKRKEVKKTRKRKRKKKTEEKEQRWYQRLQPEKVLVEKKPCQSTG